VPSSNGMPSRSLWALGVSPAARFRELRVNRTVYLLGFLLLIAPWALWFEGLQVELQTPAWILNLSHNTVTALIRISLQGFALGTNNATTFYVAVAGAIGIALFGYDRYAGGLLYSLEGPLRRREVLTAKVLLGAIIILLPVAAGTAGALVFAELSRNPGLAGPIALRGLLDATGELSFFATAMAMGSAMGTVFSALAMVTWAALPALLQSLVSNLFLVPGSSVVILNGHRVATTTLRLPHPWIAHLAFALPYLSPLQPASPPWPLAAVLGLVAWFVAWTALVLWLSYGWWERAPFERLRDAVFFPFLWNLYYAFLSLLSTLLLGAWLTHGAVYGVAWAAIYLALFVAGWFFWRYIVAWRGSGAGRPVGA